MGVGARPVSVMELVIKPFSELTAQRIFGAETIKLEAQVYARGLYEKCGFAQSSGEFLEDGIPHIEMTWTRKN